MGHINSLCYLTFLGFCRLKVLMEGVLEASVVEKNRSLLLFYSTVWLQLYAGLALALSQGSLLEEQLPVGRRLSCGRRKRHDGIM